ncbi:glycosylphosphatidylinositol anchor biosynthesis, variant 2 [Balamuthia mandrillaris]
MVVQLLSWFTFYCGVRTLSNSAEAVLCTVVLYHWPWQPSLLPASVLRRKRVISVALATLTVLLRPTSALIWAFLGLHHLLLCKDRFRFVFVHVAPTAGAVLAAGGVVDRVMYGEWTFVPYNFVYFNVMKGVGSFYGTHAWHWYLSQGLPTILITYLPLFLAGVYLSRRYLLASLVLWTVFWYSLLAHKEFRFLFAMLPVTNLYSGYALNWLWQYYYDPRKKHDNNDSRCDGDASSAKDQTNNQQSKDRRNKLQEQRLQQRQRSAGERKGGPQGRGGERGRGARWQRWMVVGVIFVVMVGQVVPALYLSVVHQRGPLQVMRYLREEHAAGRLRNDSAVHFLTPCHATPFYSHLHAPIPMQFLTCEPPPTGQLTHEYKDESDLFFEDPASFLATYYPPNISINSNGEVINMLPTHIVTFPGVAQLIANFLQHNSYVECGRFFHSHISGDRQGPYLLVFCHGG